MFSIIVIQFLPRIRQCGDCVKLLQIGEYISNKCSCFGQILGSCMRNFEDAKQLIVNSFSKAAVSILFDLWLHEIHFFSFIYLAA